MKKPLLLLWSILLVSSGCLAGQAGGRSFAGSFVQVSRADPHYFQLSDGEPYIPIGCNIAAMRDVAAMEKYIRLLSENGANFGRVWLNSSLFEPQTVYGEENEENLEHVDRLLELASHYGLKIKMCIESFRFIEPGANAWDTKASYHTSNGGPFANMWESVVSRLI